MDQRQDPIVIDVEHAPHHSPIFTVVWQNAEGVLFAIRGRAALLALRAELGGYLAESGWRPTHGDWHVRLCHSALAHLMA